MQARQQNADANAQAYHLAFEELGLDWHWDASEPVRTYIEREHAHLLRAYDADFLVNAIEGVKQAMARDKP